MNTQDFKVTVIIPTQRKRPEWLREAHDSVRFQTRLADQIIITDENKEGYEPWNKMNNAIRRSIGDAFIILGDDDKLEPDFIQKTVDRMLRYNADIVGTQLMVFGDVREEARHGFQKNPFITALCKKSMWEKVGGYDEEIGAMADADFWWMCREAGATIEKEPDTFFWYRVHETNDSKLHDLAACRERIFKKHNATEW